MNMKAFKSYEAPRTYGLRVNTAKSAVTNSNGSSCSRSPDSVDLQWIFLSGRCPSILLSTLSGRTFLSAGTKCHDTGILSSSHSGENVLDLCAAPGGKATALGAMLNGSGLLVANDISASRARALLRNIELFGITNAFVTNETPAHLGKHFPEFFHKILLDAPCSGRHVSQRRSACT